MKNSMSLQQAVPSHWLASHGITKAQVTGPWSTEPPAFILTASAPKLLRCCASSSVGSQHPAPVLAAISMGMDRLTHSLSSIIPSFSSHIPAFASMSSSSSHGAPSWSPRPADLSARKQKQSAAAASNSSQQPSSVSQPAGLGTESETVEDDEDSEVLMPRGRRLNKRDVTLFCSTCRHNTLFDDPEDLVECSCCHRVFHNTCYERHVSRTERIGLPDPDQEDIPWFHSQACAKVFASLNKQAQAGERVVDLSAGTAPGSGVSRGLGSWWPWQQQHQQTPTAAASPASSVSATDGSPSGTGYHSVQTLEAPAASWRLLQCAAVGSPASRIAMSQIYNLLSRDFGYTMGDYGSFDLAALLRRDGKPACAAVVDIHGPDAAEVFVVATRRDLRRQGNCRLLMQQLAGALHAAGIRRMVVSIDDTDETAQLVWEKLGFQPLENTVMRQLSWSLPAFSSEATEGTVYLGQELKPRKGLLA